MVTVEDYVSRIEKTCGEEKEFIVIFKYERKTEAIALFLKRAKTEKSISNMIFELSFNSVSFRLYGTGKAIFRNLKDENELRTLLTHLLL